MFGLAQMMMMRQRAQSALMAAQYAAYARELSAQVRAQDGAITLDESDYKWSDPLTLSQQKDQ